MMAYHPLALLIVIFIFNVAAKGNNEEENSLRKILNDRHIIKVFHQQNPEVKELGHQLLDGNLQSRNYITRDQVPSSCTEEYAALVNSTMCIYFDNPDATDQGVSDAPGVDGGSSEQQTILDEHNHYRSTVDPAATNMVKMYWDDKIAEVAQKYANVCPDDHDINREVPGYGIRIGQNLAWGYGDWAAAIKAWHDEVALFTYGGDNKSIFTEIGHYTQVVTSNAIRIGCGYAMCPGSYGHTYVCNYAYGQINYNEPYEDGTSCDACPDHCADSLCDCGSKLCLNGGTLNLDTCDCECKSPYTGSTCQEKDCPEKDTAPICKIAKLKGLDCGSWGNLPSDCPWLCGVCTEEDLEKPADDCPDFDMEYSCSVWPKSHCKTYSNVETICPVLCGVCPGVCPGKYIPGYKLYEDYCKNGGTFDLPTCSCQCTDKFIGDTCTQYKNCPVQADPYWCKYYPDSYCDPSRSNLADYCPYLCDRCLPKPV